jgi:hypothetical protein
MKISRLFGAVLAAGLSVIAVRHEGVALANPPEAVVANPPEVKKPIAFDANSLAWGMSPKQVAAAHDKVVDDEYRPKYQGTSPGVAMKALDNEVAEAKAEFRRTRVDFGAVPTGLDHTPLRGEYTYNNKESYLTLTRKGKTRHLFFIQDKLWKVIDEVSFADNTSYGKTFEEVVVKLATDLATIGRVVQADPAKNQFATEVDWRDANIHFRVIDRGEGGFAFAYIDRTTEANLGTLRANKPASDSDVDPDVAAAMKK